MKKFRVIFVINDKFFGGHVKSFIGQFKSICNYLDYKLLVAKNGFIIRNIQKFKFIDINKLYSFNANNIRKYYISLDLFKSLKSIVTKDTIIHVFSPSCYFTASIVKSMHENTILINSVMGGPFKFHFFPSAEIHIAVSDEQIKMCKLKNFRNHALISNRIEINPKIYIDKPYSKILNKKYILLISRLDYDKKEALIRSVDLLKKLINDYEILILGDGDFRQEFEKILQKEIPKKIQLFGNVKDVTYFFNDTALVLGMGRSILEPMLNGIPAVLVGSNGMIQLSTLKNVKIAMRNNFSGRNLSTENNIEDLYEIISKMKKSSIKEEKKDIVYFLNIRYSSDFYKQKYFEIIQSLKSNNTSILLPILEYIYFSMFKISLKIKRKFIAFYKL